MNQVLDVMKKRSSIRGYKDEPLSNEQINCLVEAALQAPTARNEQELFVSVVKKGNPILDELQNELNPNAKVNWYYDAPVVFFISGKDDFKWTALDAGIMCENIHLAAASMELGSIILGCIDGIMHGENQVKYNAQLNVPEGMSFKIAVAVGQGSVTKEPHLYKVEKQVSYITE